MNLLGPSGSTGNKNGALVDPKKFFGEEKYDQYYQELISEGRIAGENLTPDERKEGAKTYRKDKKDFKKFVDNFLNKEKKTQNQLTSTKPVALLMGAELKKEKPTEELKIKEKDIKKSRSKKLDDNKTIISKLAIMQSLLESILKSIQSDQNAKKKATEEQRKNLQKEKKRSREKTLESGAIRGIKSVGEKVFAPIRSGFDAIANFFKNVLLGGAIGWLLNFIQDPIGFFVNPMIQFFNNIIQSIFSPMNKFIDDLNNSISGFIRDFNNLIDQQLFGMGAQLPDIPDTAIKIPHIPIPKIPLVQQQAPKGMQRGGFVNMGKPTGDSVPTLLERGEYVLNRNAVSAIGRNRLDSVNFGRYSRGQSSKKPRGMRKGGFVKKPNLNFSFNTLFLGMQSGGSVENLALHELMKDEALSSLTPGVNDFIKPGGRSVISNTPWSSISDNTLIYPYVDSVGQPTIGYGSAGMRGVTMNTAPITMKTAKEYLRSDVKKILSGMKNNLKYFDSLTDKQKAGLVMFEYNSGAGSSWNPRKGYPNFVRNIQSGNIRAAIAELFRGGPSPDRIKMEQNLLSSGPKQLVGPGTVGPAVVGPGTIGGKGLLPSLSDQTGLSRFIPKMIRSRLRGLINYNRKPNVNVIPIPTSGSGNLSSASSAQQSPVPNFSASSGDVEIALTKSILNVTS